MGSSSTTRIRVGADVGISNEALSTVDDIVAPASTSAAGRIASRRFGCDDPPRLAGGSDIYCKPLGCEGTALTEAHSYGQLYWLGKNPVKYLQTILELLP